MDTKGINSAIMKMSKRSENADYHNLVQSFVDIGPLFNLLSANENQVLYGRRGTGKTHALVYLSDMVKKKGDRSIFIDLTNLGSTGGTYTDKNLGLNDRATTLLVDVLTNIYEKILEVIVNDDSINLGVAGPLLDRFGESITQVRVTGNIQEEEEVEKRRYGYEEVGASLNANPKSIACAELKVSKSDGETNTTTLRTIRNGSQKYYVHFGSVRSALEKLIQIMSPQRVWVFLDEWSNIPLELQPYLADLIRRSFFPVKNITTKIAAIEYRSNFQIPLERNEYIGFELGADVSVNIDLDDFMVFDNNPARARSFFKSLFFKHLKSSDEFIAKVDSFENEGDMVSSIFTQLNAFDELVVAAEGVPRDAIHIASLAAQYAFENKISIPHIRKAAREWYLRGKEKSIDSKDRAVMFLNWVIDRVIGERKARAFLLRSDQNFDLIQNLFDSRILHIRKKNISSHDEPGIRYNVFKLDYGCYVDLINTSKKTTGLLQDDTTGEYIEVPPDDYRSIRRAILKIEDFLDHETSLKQS